MTRILVLSDTHIDNVRELPESVIRAVKETDWVVHCGDYTSLAVLDELRSIALRFVGVYGNADTTGIRYQLPFETIFEVEDKKIAVTHPHWGGPPDGLEEKLAKRYPSVDAVLFGHTHEPCVKHMNGVLLLNPGQTFASFLVPASVGILIVDGGELSGEIVTLG